MTALITLCNATAQRLNRLDWLIPTLARFLFVAVLFMYFWNSALTKIGDGVMGIFQPSVGAYAQIFPKAMEAAGYDISQLGVFHWAVAVAGTWAEFILPVLIAIGLLTRLAALGMIGFLIVQTLTDLYGHGVIGEAKTIGAWFDNTATSLLMDQRSLWVFLLVVMVIKGAGPLSLDRLFAGAATPDPDAQKA